MVTAQHLIKVWKPKVISTAKVAVDIPMPVNLAEGAWVVGATTEDFKSVCGVVSSSLCMITRILLLYDRRQSVNMVRVSSFKRSSSDSLSNLYAL